jgi:flagella basal body P-ring formation protein FlgA
MFIKLLITLSLLSLELSAALNLKSHYYIQDKLVTLCDIDPKASECSKLFDIAEDKNSKRIKSSKLVEILKTFGYKDIHSSHNYTQFTHKSPIDTTKLENFIVNSYKSAYSEITILRVEVHPRSFIRELPKEFSIFLAKGSYLKNRGVLYIQTLRRKKIFFNYLIYAKLPVIKTKKKIAKGETLSIINLKKESIILNKFRAMPLQNIPESRYQAKHTLRKNSLVTSRDFIGLYLIKRGSKVQVNLQDSNIEISFSATAKQNGRYGDTISIINSNGKKMRGRVIAHNRVEIIE